MLLRCLFVCFHRRLDTTATFLPGPAADLQWRRRAGRGGAEIALPWPSLSSCGRLGSRQSRPNTHHHSLLINFEVTTLRFLPFHTLQTSQGRQTPVSNQEVVRATFCTAFRTWLRQEIIPRTQRSVSSLQGRVSPSKLATNTLLGPPLSNQADKTLNNAQGHLEGLFETTTRINTQFLLAQAMVKAAYCEGIEFPVFLCFWCRGGRENAPISTAPRSSCVPVHCWRPALLTAMQSTADTSQDSAARETC